MALAVIDGGIDTPWGKGVSFNNGVEDGKISPDAVSYYCYILNPSLCFTVRLTCVIQIAESYWHLHSQHKSAFTQELDIRPYVEKF